jgi:hypothetical protein
LKPSFKKGTKAITLLTAIQNNKQKYKTNKKHKKNPKNNKKKEREKKKKV